MPIDVLGGSGYVAGQCISRRCVEMTKMTWRKKIYHQQEALMSASHNKEAATRADKTMQTTGPNI
eukprot:8370587-Ditylum_brightwellii.AAC.1